MRPFRAALPAILAAAFTLIAFIPDADAQIRRRRQLQPDCPGGVCPAPLAPLFNAPIGPELPPLAPPTQPAPEPCPEPTIAQPAPAPGEWYKILTFPRGAEPTQAEIDTVVSWSKRAVRILNGNACGTGSLCGRDADNIYILTNAHVAGSRVGNVVRCEALLADGSATEKFNAAVVESAYSSRTATDWALLRADARYMAGLEPIKLSTQEPTESDLTGTWGCPRCEVPRGQIIKTETLGSVWYWQPNSIGGQSGSAVVQRGRQFGLLTWTIAGDGAGQLTATIYRQSRRQNTDGPARTPEMETPRAAPDPANPGSTYTLDGVELIEGYHATVDVGNYPIWDDGTAPTDPPTDPPGTGPGDPPTNPCPDMPEEERRLRDRLRERGIDWVLLLQIILELMDLLQNRAAPAPAGCAG